MRDRIRWQLMNWLSPERARDIARNLAMFVTALISVIASDVMVENDALALLTSVMLTVLINLLAGIAGYIDGQIEEENKVKLDPSKGKFAVVYYNEMPVGAVNLSGDKAEVD